MTPEIARLEQEVVVAKKKLTDAIRAAQAQPVKQYTLRHAGSSAGVTLTELFGGSNELLVVHNMGRACPYCTLWADGFSSMYKHLANRCAFVLTTPDEPAVAAAFAGARGWTFPVISHAGTTFAADMGFHSKPGSFEPGISAFYRDGNEIVRTGSRRFGPGDDFCALWPMLDLLRNGVGAWEPKYHY
ncbi:MAG: DUF899 family protein [Phycisphaerales bacterium]|nr:DUF899 family protein [Phycisphaerales bacterium]